MNDKEVFAIGVVGYKAAGKDTVCELLKKRGFAVLRTSDAIRADLRTLGNENPTTPELIAKGNEGRATSGDCGYWMRRLAEMAQKDGHKKIVFNGVRHPEEVDALEKIYGKRFAMIGIVAPTAARAMRFLKRGQAGDPAEFEAFLKIDDTDRGIGEPCHGQQVDRALARVSCENVYNNAKKLEDLEAWLDFFLKRVII